MNFSGADLVSMIGRVSTEGVTVAIGDDMLIAIVVFEGLVLGPLKDQGLDQDQTI